MYKEYVYVDWYACHIIDVWTISAYALIVCRLVLTSIEQMNETGYWSKVTVTMLTADEISARSGGAHDCALHIVPEAASFWSRSAGLISRSVSEVWPTKWHWDRFFSEYFDFLYQYHFTNTHIFWARFAKLRKATITLVMSVRVSAWNETLGSNWTDFDENWYLNIRKICRENSSFITIGQEWRIFYMKTDICTVMIISRSILLRMGNVPDKRWR